MSRVESTESRLRKFSVYLADEVDYGEEQVEFSESEYDHGYLDALRWTERQLRDLKLI